MNKNVAGLAFNGVTLATGAAVIVTNLIRPVEPAAALGLPVGLPRRALTACATDKSEYPE